MSSKYISGSCGYEQTGDNAGGDPQTFLSQEEGDDGTAGRAESKADAHLALAKRDFVGEKAVSSKSGKGEREHAEGERDLHGKLSQSDLMTHEFRHTLDPV